jgi:signal transduction histidine kinase
MCAGALRETPAPAPEAAAELLESIEESATWAFHIIQDLLDVASIDAGRLSIDVQPQALTPILMRAQAMFLPVAADRELTLDVATPADDRLPLVTIDADRVLQVLGNLLQNACKFTPAGGTIRVSATALPGAVEVAVSDTGPGIAPDDISKVFERFWHAGRQSKVRSTGLGLAIARGIVDAHGGRLWVDSTVGRGSTFFFTLPTTLRGDRQ